MPTSADPIADIARYYSGKLAEYGATPLGVDWSCQPTQYLRFAKLVRGLQLPRGASLNDLGCGYGALLDYLDAARPGHSTDYMGFDASPAMVHAGRSCFRNRPGCHFEVGSAPSRVADYSVASGAFNVKLDHPNAVWETVVQGVLLQLGKFSKIGFAFNMLAASEVYPSPVEELYVGDSVFWSQWCAQELGMDVTVLTGYGMKEFTVVCRH